MLLPTYNAFITVLAILSWTDSSTGTKRVPATSTLSSPTQYLHHDAQFSEFSAANIVLQKLLIAPHAETKYTEKDQANVLILHPIYAGSHEVVLRRVGVELVKRGHKVTQLRWMSDHLPIDIKKHVPGVNSSVFGPSDDSKTTTNQTDHNHMDILTVSVQNRDLRYPYMSKEGSMQPPTKLLWDTERSFLNIPTDVFGIIDAHCSTLLGDAALLQALNSTGYTVAFVDVISNECSLALARLLNIPVVGYWGFPFQGAEPRRMGVYQVPSILPMMMSEFGVTMSFWERVTNTVLAILEELLVTYHNHNTDYWIQRLHPGLPPSADLLHQVDIMLISVDWAVDFPKLMPPHVNYIGCLTCRPPSPFDDELKDWMSSAGKAGVIVFSFGLTGFDPSVVPKKFRLGSLKALEKLEQKVVLHFDPTKLDYQPSNVLARQFLPQQDLLAHEQSRLFVSHCGMNSVNEALYHGKPLICVPNFADQGDITRRVVDRSLGLAIAKTELTEETLYEAITEVLTNPKYRKNAEKISRLWKSHPSGLDRAVEWLERVHQFGHFDFMRFPGHNLSYFQYFGLDVWITLALMGTFFSVISLFLVKISITKTIRHLSQKSKVKVN